MVISGTFFDASRKWAPGEGSETPDCRRDHLIHRKRSPFPYEGKALTPLNRSARPGRARRGNASLAAIWNDPPQLCYLVSGLWSLYKKRARYGKIYLPYRAPLLTIDY